MKNNENNYFLKSERLGFGIWQKNDLNLALEIWGNNEISKFVGGPFSNEQVRTRLMKEISNYIENKIQYWPLFLLKNREHIGCCGLKPYDTEKNILETGFYLKTQYQGAGYAKEAAQTVIKYAFEELKVTALFAGHHPKNKASENLLIRLGFQRTGTEYYEPTCLEHPAYLLTRENYLKLCY